MNYIAPETYEEACRVLDDYATRAKILAGGTDLMIQMERGQRNPDILVSLDRIPGWDALTIQDGISMGAGTSYRQLEKSLSAARPYAALIEASRQVGGIQVRNVATVAGNLCNASPAADSVPPLLVMDALLTITGLAGTRSVPINEFITGRGQTVLASAEILTQIDIPALPQRSSTVFLKAGRRRAMEISFASVAARITLADDGETIQMARIALGAVAPTPIRVPAAEQLLQGERLSAEIIKEAAHLAVQATHPISDVRASAEYRRHLVAVMVQRAIEVCLQRIHTEAA
jgi:carbon-monoxide dehydrogenase medium subunit